MFKLIIFLIAGFFFIYIGRRVWVKGNTRFIAGYGETFVPKNEQKLARGFGLIIIIFGIESIIFPILSFFVNGLGLYYGILIAINLLSVFFIMVKDQFA